MGADAVILLSRVAASGNGGTSDAAARAMNEGGPRTGGSALVGQDLTPKVIEVDPRRNRLILSDNAAIQELRRQRKARAAAELNVGIADGPVQDSEINWDKGVNPMTVHRVGDPGARRGDRPGQGAHLHFHEPARRRSPGPGRGSSPRDAPMTPRSPV